MTWSMSWGSSSYSSTSNLLWYETSNSTFFLRICLFPKSPNLTALLAILSSYDGPIPLPVVPIDSFLSLTLSILIWLGRINAQPELTKNLLSKFIPASTRSFISLSRASKDKTTPLPITQFTFGWRIPEGVKWRTVCWPFTLIVCPALCPPWKRQTAKTSSLRASTIFPLPSSPHWRPRISVFEATLFLIYLLLFD